MQRPSGELFDVRLVLALLAALTVARLVVNAWLDPLPLSGDEAQYWLYGEHLAGGYYSKPPLLPWLMRLSTEAFGNAHWAMRLPSVLCHLAIAGVVFALARALFDRPTGTLAALLYLTLPAVSVSSLIASTDPPMMLGWAVASLGLVHALRSGALIWWALAGAGLGLGLLAKYTAVAWLAGAAILLLADPAWRQGRRARGVAAAVLACLLVLAPNLVWNARHGFPTVAHVAENADLASAGAATPLSERLAELGDFLVSQVGVFGPIAFALLLLLLMRPATWRDPRFRFALVLGLPLLAAITAQALANRANANWAAPAYLGFAVAVAAFLVQGGRRRLAAVTVGLHLLVFLLVVGAAAMHRHEPSPFDSSLDPFRKLRGVEQVASAVAPVLRAHPDAWLVMADRMLMANVLEATDWPLERSVMWNADGDVDNHWEMVTRFPDGGPHRYVIVTRGDPRDAMADRFATLRPLRVVRVRTHADRGFDLYVYLARDFQGYAGAAGPGSSVSVRPRTR